jgi:hypothetical protein
MEEEFFWRGVGGPMGRGLKRVVFSEVLADFQRFRQETPGGASDEGEGGGSRRAPSCWADAPGALAFHVACRLGIDVWELYSRAPWSYPMSRDTVRLYEILGANGVYALSPAVDPLRRLVENHGARALQEILEVLSRVDSD